MDNPNPKPSLRRRLKDVQTHRTPLLFLFGHSRTRIFDDKFQQTVIIIHCQRYATVIRELDGV